MKLSIEKKKKFYIPNDPEGGFVVIRNLEQDELWMIEQETSVFEMDGDEKQVFSFKPVEREAKKVDSCIADWGNLFDVNGEELELNRLNRKKARKFLVVDLDPDNKEEEKTFRFYEWVNNKRKEYASEVENEEEVAKGNL